MSITSEQYREALRHFPSGVTIVTIQSPQQERPHGLTVSAFTSLSPEPPLIMIAVDHRSSAHALLQEKGATFAVNILPHDMMEMSNRFAWLKDGDRFAEGDWETAVTGAPVLNDALSWMDCTIHDQKETGTHTIFIGKIEASATPQADKSPLIYWNRGYRSLQSAE